MKLALALIGAGAALVAFALANALYLYFSAVPKTALNVTAPLIGQVKISGVPDPYHVGVGVLRGVLLLAIGLIGGKLIDTGLAELRERRREEALRRYYEQYGYQYQQY
ncbi:hypothetical protein [Pyrobaculum neutrophilum]|uniref:Uncharacterized protein n=1 Tax=Pyrobaculum neutrophilum (strain DSM 2338 / JCM 9278 / NBRC 100436 / V24Sta) TaxID=444157 RepID=B1Y8P9_PYRNV|nr:hypothetical protein [Pyrobaculum neutrophilum]ACB40128.1 conserved hypothetical protein [Pyrobaculum neutrophilum V24Sta]